MVKDIGKEGHMCYAEKQIGVWKALEDRAAGIIRSTAELYSSLDLKK